MIYVAHLEEARVEDQICGHRWARLVESTKRKCLAQAGCGQSENKTWADEFPLIAEISPGFFLLIPSERLSRKSARREKQRKVQLANSEL